MQSCHKTLDLLCNADFLKCGAVVLASGDEVDVFTEEIGFGDASGACGGRSEFLTQGIVAGKCGHVQFGHGLVET